METKETFHERQENELHALKAIYSAELRDLREADFSKNSCPPEIVITLYPQQVTNTYDQEVHTQIDLHVTCVGTYPEDVPVIELEKSKGISRENVLLLQGQLESLASNLRGEVMIHDLAQHVKEFLLSCYKPGFKSFHDEMENRLEQQNLQQMQLKKLKEDEEKQAIQEEIRRKTEALEEEKGRRRRRYRGNSEDKENDLVIAEDNLHPGKNAERSRSCCIFRASSFPNQRYNTVSEGNGDFLCDHHGTRIIHFTNHGERQVQRGMCMSHNPKGSIVYPALDIITGECMALVEWTMKCQDMHIPKEESNNFTASSEKNGDISCVESANYRKQIASIEQEFTFLQKLYHPNLVHYLNMKYTEEKKCIIINILQEFIIGTNLAIYLTENLSMDTDVLRHCAIGILNALDYLHQNNVVHKDLRDTSVFIDKSGVVRLGDYSLDKRLSTICQSSAEEKLENIFPPSTGRGGKKGDIHRFGILLLSLMEGCIITDSEPEISTKIQADLRDFLLKCLAKEDRQRCSAKELLEHSFVKHPIEKGFNPKPNWLKKEKRRDSVSDSEERDVDIPQYLPANPKGPSRIHNEFDIIALLGKGAYGDVLKAKNKLDGRLYAIKRIKLNPKNKQLNKKITREVKLLSRLNHENVVRYYNSWIECAILDSNVDSSRSTPFQDTRSDSEMEKSQVNRGSENEDLCPKITIEEPSDEWSTSYRSSGTAEMEDEESDDDEDEDEDDWITFMSRVDTSESIVILEEGCENKSASSNGKNGNDSKTEKSPAADQESSNSGNEVQFMYIQMEFCEKSTLRTAIDGGLHENEARVRRLFRELVEGLVHIHLQGMIHRDLKPVNIFLDSNDHVKIGDFGLATTNIITRTGSFVNEQMLEGIDYRSGDNRSIMNYFGDGSMTADVGTALYSAPELSVNGGKALYSQKVDIYSLGIIFFEMCYHPLKTGSERVKVLLSIRHKEIIMPTDFTEKDMPQQFHIIRWLLNHDPNKRPTSHELLQSDYVPPPQEAELQEMVRHTLLNPQSKAYKYLVDSCFNQGVTPAEDATFYMTLHPMNIGSLPSAHKHLLQEAVKERIVAVFRRHGAICVPTPLLLPSSASHRSSGAHCNAKNGYRRPPPDPSQENASYVRLMTRSGGIVSLPHDLRMSFARYVAWNGISLLKRYSVDRVYREKRPYGFHPRELYECAFDIVTPDSGYLLAEAEILSVAWEVVCEFPALRELNYCIQLSHTSLLRAILLHLGIEEGKHQDIYRILWEARDEKYTKFQVQTRLMSLSLSEQVIQGLLNLVEVEGPLPKLMSGAFKGVTRRKGEAASLAQQAFHELETIIGHVEALGVKCPVVIAPGLVYNVHQYSGMMCQMVCEMKTKRRKGSLNIIAAGGRYDSLLASYRQIVHLTGMPSHESSQSAVGISLSLERILSALQHESEAESTWSGSMPKLSPLDAVVCGMGQVVTFIKQMARIVRDLWSAGIRTSLIDSLQKIEDVQDYCRDFGIPHIIILKDAESGTVRVSSWEKDRYNEKKVSVCDLVEHMQRAVKVSMSGDNILGCDTNMMSGISAGLSGRSMRNCGDTSPSYSVPSGGNMAPLSPSTSSSSCSSAITSASRSRISIHFIAGKSNLTSHMKRRYENMMKTHIEQILTRYSPSMRLEILGVQLDADVIRIVISLLNIDADKNAFEKSVAMVIERLPEDRKYLSELCEEIHNLKFEKNSAVLILYSLIDNFYKAL